MPMLFATDVAIAEASKSGTLRCTEEIGRFGPFWAISDEHGLIEVALSEVEAQERLTSVLART